MRRTGANPVRRMIFVLEQWSEAGLAGEAAQDALVPSRLSARYRSK
jgi:hypothetical protein